MDDKEINSYFASLVMMFQAAAYQHLGKIVNPVSNKVEKSMEQAKLSIDILVMLREKTKNNLLKEEFDFLVNTISNLQLNYVDELKKKDEQPKEDKATADDNNNKENKG